MLHLLETRERIGCCGYFSKSKNHLKNNMERIQATRTRKASTAQLAAMAEHMQAHPALAAGISSSLQGRANLETAWKSLAAKLNSMGGPLKTVAKWKQTWRDMRNNVKRRAAHNTSELRGYGPNSTGHGPSTLNEFSQVDEQVLSIMGPVAVYGLEDVACTEPNIMLVPETMPVPEQAGVEEVVAQPPKRKRRRVTPQIDSFDEKLLQLEREKLQTKIEKNLILNSWTGPCWLQSERIINYLNQGVGAMEFICKFNRTRLVGAVEEIIKIIKK